MSPSNYFILQLRKLRPNVKRLVSGRAKNMENPTSLEGIPL